MISFILFITIGLSEYIAYASIHHIEIIKSTGVERTLMILGVILPLAFIISMIYGYKHYSTFNSWINTASSVWIGLVIYILIASLIVFVLVAVKIYLDINIPFSLVSGISVLVVFVFVVYGVWNASHIRITNMEVNSLELSQNWNNKKIVLISDLHLGQQRGLKYLKNIISKINEEKPDIVFIVGDLIDGPAFPYKEWLSEFNKLNTQLGIFYTEGNHEKYNQEYSSFKSSLPESLIDITDKEVNINNTQIIGLDYKQKETAESIKAELESQGFDSSKPSIILIHDPKSVKHLSDLGAMLVLSGHTHGGQFFPFTTLVNLIYKKYTHGVTYTDATASVTGYGVGTSIIPMRIGTKPEIIILKIK